MLPGFDQVETGLTSSHAKLVRPIYAFLQRRYGPVKSYVIEEALDCRGTAVRGVVSALRDWGYPVCSSQDGYWIARTPEDILGTIEHLTARMEKMEQALTGLRIALETMREEEEARRAASTDLQTTLGF